MKHQLKKKMILASAVLGMVLGLTACGHSNPLNKEAPDTSAKFLVHASNSAEKKLKVFNGANGSYYGACMEKQAKADICQKLYKEMVKYGKSTEGFNTITVADLDNQAIYKKLKPDYHRIWFVFVD